MAIYILIACIAGVLQIGTIYFLRINFLGNLLFAIPVILIHQLLFAWNYANAPKFIIIWFLTSAITSGLAFLASHFIWHEHVSVANIIGIVLIVSGVVFLQIK